MFPSQRANQCNAIIIDIAGHSTFTNLVDIKTHNNKNNDNNNNKINNKNYKYNNKNNNKNNNYKKETATITTTKE